MKVPLHQEDAEKTLTLFSKLLFLLPVYSKLYTQYTGDIRKAKTCSSCHWPGSGGLTCGHRVVILLRTGSLLKAEGSSQDAESGRSGGACRWDMSPGGMPNLQLLVPGVHAAHFWSVILEAIQCTWLENVRAWVPSCFSRVRFFATP